MTVGRAGRRAAWLAGGVLAGLVPWLAAGEAVTGTAKTLLPAGERVPVRLAWDVNLGARHVNRIFLAPADVDDDNLFVQTLENDLGMFRRRDGMARWWVRFDETIQYTPTVTRYSVYVVTSRQLTSIDRISGQVRWRLPTPTLAAANVAVIESTKEGEDDNPRIIFAGIDRAVRELRPISRENKAYLEAQKKRTDGKLALPNLLNVRALETIWTHATDAQAVPPVALMPNGNFYFADYAQRLHGLNVDRLTFARPEELASIRFQRPLRVGPVLAWGDVLMSCLDTSLYCLNAASLEREWRVACGQPLTMEPQPFEDPHLHRRSVAVKSGDTGALVMIRLDKGDEEDREQWEVPGAVEVVARFADMTKEPARRCLVAIRNQDGSLSGRYFADGPEGTADFKVQLGLVSAWCRNTRDPLVYVGAGDGTTLAAIEFSP